MAYRPTATDPMPTIPVPYHHLLRGPLAHGWQPVVAFLLVLMGLLFVFLQWVGLNSILFLLSYMFAPGRADAGRIPADLAQLITFIVKGHGLAAFILIAPLSIRAAYLVRPGFVSSVVGRLRWGWLGLCTIVLLPLWIGHVLVTKSLAGPTPDLALKPGWETMLGLVLFTILLQSAGEEYLLRGWVMQNVGAWIRRSNLALLVSIVVSAGLSAVAYGSFDVWILFELGIFATSTVVLTWRTGGLEAAIVMHAVSNAVNLSYVFGTGDVGDVLITETTSGSPQQLVYSIIVQAVAVPLVLLLARWRGIERTYQPRPLAPPQHPPRSNDAPHVPGGGAPGYPGRVQDSGPGQVPGMPGTSPWGT